MIPSDMAKAALALPYSGLHGSLGGTTIVQRPDGPVVRARVYRRRVLTSGQAAGAARLRVVGEAWRGLDDASYAAWKRHAELQAWRNPATGAVVVPQTFRLFSGLATKALQVEPLRSLAGFMPPERAFLGDGAIVVVTLPLGRGRGGVENPSEAGSTPSLPSTWEGTPADSLRDDLASPPSADPPSGEGSVVGFTSSGANAPGIVTELLVQPLVNARRAVYRDKYVSRGFVAFEGAETVEVPLASGAWACAYRFVRADTGQETALVELRVVVVEG